MQGPYADATRRFLHGFWAVRQRLLRHAEPLLRDRHGIGVGDYFLLDHVAHGDVSPTEIATTMELPPHTVSRRLDALEKGRLLLRTLHPSDARRRVLTLTPDGVSRLRDATDTMRHETEAFLAVLEPAALDAFLDSLETLAKDRQS